MYEDIKIEIIKTALKLVKYNIIKMSAGNLSVRANSEHIVITPSGMDYEEIKVSNLIVIDIDGHIIEGGETPSVDSKALLYIYNNLQRVNAIIHTHQVYASAVGLVLKKIPSILTTLANAVGGEVVVAPYCSAANIEMGMEVVKYIKNKNAVILKNHGVIGIGQTLREALYAVVYLEDAAKALYISKIFGNPSILTKEQTVRAIEVFRNYGQK